MSRDVGNIEFYIPCELNVGHWQVLISSFAEVGFSLFDNISSDIQYLPLNALDDEFEWQISTLDYQSFFEVIEKKIAQKEQIGFFIPKAYEDALIIVATTRLDGNTEISINFSGTVKFLSGTSTADFSYYLSFLVPIFLRLSKTINIECHQYIDR